MLALLIAPALALAGPVQRVNDDGVIDWGSRTLQVTGVGTPRVVSPTGSLTPEDPYEVARRDARERLERLVARVRVGEKRVGAHEALRERVREVVEKYVAADPIRLADGTIHLPARVELGWIGEALAGVPAPAETASVDVTGLVLRLNGGLEPRLRVVVGCGARKVQAGFPGDPLGAAGVGWFEDLQSARASGVAGARPRVVQARVRGGVLTLLEEACGVLDGLPGGLALVLE